MFPDPNDPMYRTRSGKHSDMTWNELERWANEEIAKLREINDVLLTACEMMLSASDSCDVIALDSAYKAMDVAVAKAKGCS